MNEELNEDDDILFKIEDDLKNPNGKIKVE